MTDASLPAMLDIYRGAPALVLGGAGFIGRWVARLLSQAGADVTLSTRHRQATEVMCTRYGIRGRVVEVDLSLREKVFGLVRDTRPSVVFNLAGYGVDPSERDPIVARRINVDLVGWVSEAVHQTSRKEWAGQHLVHAGSALEYGAAEGNLHEETAPRPTTLYGETKLAGTQHLLHYRNTLGIRAACGRLFTVYGPGEHPHRLLPTLIRAAGETGRIPLTDGSQRRDFGYVADIALGLLYLGSSTDSGPGVFNIATEQLVSVRDFVQAAARILLISEKRLTFGSQPKRVEEMQHSRVSADQLRALVGWVPATGIPEGITATVNHLRAMELGEVEG